MKCSKCGQQIKRKREVFTIEGEWTGYNAAQRRVVHREHTRSPERVAAIRQLGSILYTDNTRLMLRVLEGKHDKAVDGYSKLIADCLRHGVSSVEALPSD